MTDATDDNGLERFPIAYRKGETVWGTRKKKSLPDKNK